MLNLVVMVLMSIVAVADVCVIAKACKGAHCFEQTFNPSPHVCSDFALSGLPHFPSQAPPFPQQLELRPWLKVTHLEHSFGLAGEEVARTTDFVAVLFGVLAEQDGHALQPRHAHLASF